MFEYSPIIQSPKQLAKIIKAESDIRSRRKSASDIAIACRADFLTFRKYVCGQETYPHMLVWDKALNTGVSNHTLQGIAGDDVSILAPRNSAKSTFLAQWVAWVIGTHTMAGISLRVLYISYVIEVASNKSRQIKAIIESEKYQEVFPKVRKWRSKWGENEWCIDQAYAGLRTIDEPYTLACSGLFGAINSKRSHLMVFDDVLKSRQEANNKAIQDRMYDNYYNVIRFTRFSGSRAVNLGTRFAKYDVHNRIFIPENGWKVIKQSALITNADNTLSSLCNPVGNGLGISVEELLREKEEDEETFLLQRQNEIPETNAEGIKLHHIKHAWIPQQFERLVLGLDLAVSDKSYSDHTAFVMVGVTNDSLYVCDAWQEKIKGNMRKIDIIHSLWGKWRHTCDNPLILAVDKNKYSISIEGDLEDYIKESTDYFAGLLVENVASTNRGKDKLDRLNSHSFLFEKGKVFFNKVSAPLLPNKLTPIQQLVSEITDYNPLDHNDLLDSLEVAIFTARMYLQSQLSVY